MQLNLEIFYAIKLSNTFLPLASRSNRFLDNLQYQETQTAILWLNQLAQ